MNKASLAEKLTLAFMLGWLVGATLQNFAKAAPTNPKGTRIIYFQEDDGGWTERTWDGGLTPQ